MPKIGFKIKFKNIESFKNNIFIITFDLKYNDKGFLYFENVKDDYFDCGDCRILLEDVANNLTKETLKKYDNGVYILSVCKYLVDKMPNLYSIQYESLNSRDIYYRQEIIDDYNKILQNKEENL